VTGSTVTYEGGPEKILVNNTTWSGELPDMSTRSDFTAYTTNGDTIDVSETPRKARPRCGRSSTLPWMLIHPPAPDHLPTDQPPGINVDTYNAAYAAAFAKARRIYRKAVRLVYSAPPTGRPGLRRQPPLSGGKLGGNVDIDKSGGRGKMLFLQGKPIPPKNYEAGWLDTVVVMPGQVTRIAVRWAPTDISTDAPQNKLYYPFDPNSDGLFAYVWHCHIIDHEDNEMMRPDVILLNPKGPCRETGLWSRA